MNETKNPKPEPVPRLVARAARELAEVASRIGLFGAADKLRDYGAAIDRGSDLGERAAAAVLATKAAYDQSATKRVVTALAEVGRALDARRSPLRRVGRPKAVAKTKNAG